ncbi:putative quinol monooxygenase [Sediminibacillus albus]|uniref:Antibiotic biosynthesis monooxygenase n=1 Tax=Sediminibacillus albus TaxID=407036 RepID=A0A1G9AIB7_9BACI|nr:antibiotic biosynthesis monooxygenase family protein [Sediminibacillus albus]SDK27011.1 Antibiotic biosynthesis monooxygenase [Sediminibacillus albus]
MNAHKVIIAGWFTVDPSKRDEVVKAHEDLVKRARQTPGCLDLAITADPVDPARINNFEFWQSEEDLQSFRAVANPPKQITPMLRVEMLKHEIDKSGPPF